MKRMLFETPCSHCFLDVHLATDRSSRFRQAMRLPSAIGTLFFLSLSLPLMPASIGGDTDVPFALCSPRCQGSEPDTLRANARSKLQRKGEQNMKTHSRLFKLAGLVALIGVAALLISNPAQAYRPTAVEFQFGSVGITRGQTARLNVINIGREALQVSLNFSDSNGRLIRQSVEILQPDHAAFLDISPSGVDEGAGRLQIHGALEIGIRANGDGSVRQIIPTLEVFDNETGKTQIALGACDGSV
jgi:hypothetical protein